MVYSSGLSAHENTTDCLCFVIDIPAEHMADTTRRAALRIRACSVGGWLPNQRFPLGALWLN